MLEIHLGSKSNTRVLKKPLVFHNKKSSLVLFPKRIAVCSAGLLLLTSAGTSRLLPKCWLKDRHQASVYPFMLGTYFFTVSSLSLSQTPSSLWIYGENKQQGVAMPSCYYGNGKSSGLCLTHTHPHARLLRLQESLTSN